MLRKSIPILPLGPCVPVSLFSHVNCPESTEDGITDKAQTCKQDILHLSWVRSLTSLCSDPPPSSLNSGSLLVQGPSSAWCCNLREGSPFIQHWLPDPLPGARQPSRRLDKSGARTEDSACAMANTPALECGEAKTRQGNIKEWITWTFRSREALRGRKAAEGMECVCVCVGGVLQY